MGNWRNRPPRRFFYQQRAPRSPPRPYHDHELHNSGSCDDGVPPWEKKFCAMVGSVPWWKIVDAQKFMNYCHSNVVNWDDSAGREAFHTAKKRFWAEINGLPREGSLPDPDMFIDEINWNPVIDPGLIDDLELEYFAPDDDEGKGGYVTRSSQYVVPSEQCNENSGKVENPWEPNYPALSSEYLQNQSQGWSSNQWDNNNNELRNSNNNDNAWGCNGRTKGWGDGDSKAWDWNKNNDNKGWGDSRDAAWGTNWPESKSWDVKEGWGDGRGHTRGRGSFRSYKSEKRNLDSRRCDEGWGGQNSGYQRRESFQQYSSSYRNSRFPRSNGQTGQTGHGWKIDERESKRVSFTQK